MYFSVLIFIFGLVIGSFLNVLILRLPQDKSILGFSKCPKCRKKISWYDNIPILSFFILRGRCRNCKSKISWQYPLVELTTAFLFLFYFWVFGYNLPFLIYVLFLLSFLTVIAFIDFNYFIILDSLILIGFFVSLSYLLLNTFYLFPSECHLLSCSFKNSILGAAFFSGLFGVLFLASKGRWIGLGDAKLGAWLGFIFGFKNAIDIFYLTFLIGFIFAIISLSLKKAGLKTEVPLGSIMAGASILFLFSGFSILDLIDGDLIRRLWLKDY